MAIKKVYKSFIPSVNYVTARGRTCVFKDGRFETDHPDEIQELDAMWANKSNPHIFVDPNETEIDTTLQEKIRLAQQEATLRVLEEAANEKAQVSGETQPQGTSEASAVSKTMTPAALLGVTSSASLAGLTQNSNSK